MVRPAPLALALALLPAAAAFAPAARDAASAATATRLAMTVEEAAARDPVRVGVIGCGRIGLVHLGAINKAPGVLPVVVSNPTVSKAEAGVWSRRGVGSGAPLDGDTRRRRAGPRACQRQTR